MRHAPDVLKRAYLEKSSRTSSYARSFVRSFVRLSHLLSSFLPRPPSCLCQLENWPVNRSYRLHGLYTCERVIIVTIEEDAFRECARKERERERKRERERRDAHLKCKIKDHY